MTSRTFAVQLSSYQIGILDAILSHDIEQGLELQAQHPDVAIFATSVAETREIQRAVLAAKDQF